MSDRVKWCLVGAVGAMAIGWLPWFTWTLVEKGSEWAWARFLLRGAVLVYLPNDLIGEAVGRTGWINGFAVLAIHLLTLGFWFVVLYGVATLWYVVRLRRARL